MMADYVNAYDSRLKTWTHRFHEVATAYLPNYLGGALIASFSRNRGSQGAAEGGLGNRLSSTSNGDIAIFFKG